MANQMMDDLQNAVPENYDLNTQGPHGETSVSSVYYFVEQVLCF